jgi:5'-3' exonuclease
MEALIDGDVILYRSCWVCQKTHYTHQATGEFFDGKKKAKDWFKETYDDLPDFETGWDIVEEIEPFKNVKFLMNNYIDEICKLTKSETYRVFLSPSENFRHKIAVTQPYKANRPPAPHHKDEARAYLLKAHKAEVGKNIEADDLLGLHQTTETCIASVDKDLYMIPGRHYDIVKQEKLLMDPLSADDWFFTQLITGDRTDNIRGLQGYGPAAARRLLDSFSGDRKGLVQEIEELYVDQYGPDGKAVMIEHAQLVYILRPGDSKGREAWRTMLFLDEG